MTETWNRSVKKRALAAVLCLVLLCFIPGPRHAFSWPANALVQLEQSHESLCEAAYDALQKQPAMRPDPTYPAPVFPPRDAIVKQVGDPDRDTSVPYSNHVFNPKFSNDPRARGNADKAVQSQHKELSDLMLESYGQAFKPAEAAKAAAWLAHFVQDLTSPYHVLGMPGSHVLSMTIDSRTTGPQTATHKLLVGMDTLLLRFQKHQQEQKNVDWFDPWYYDYNDRKGTPVSAQISGSSHMAYEAFFSPGHSPPAAGYSPSWTQGFNTAVTFAQRMAQRTRAAVDADMTGDIFKAQTRQTRALLLRAVEGTFSAWRASFSAMRLGNIVISPAKGTGNYRVIVRAKNFDDRGSASNLELKYTVRDAAGNAVGSAYSPMSGGFLPGQEQNVPAVDIAIPASAKVLKIEMKGDFSHTPDAGITQRSYDVRQWAQQTAAGGAAAGGTASLSLTKRAIPPTGMSGQVFNYLYKVQNTGKVRLTGVKVEDDKCIPVVTVTPGMADKPLDPGMDREFYCDMKIFNRTTNRAVAKAEAPGGTEVSSAPATFTVTIAPPGTVLLPHVLRLTREAAQYKLQEAGLQVGQVTERFDDSVPAGEVVSQNPDPETVPVVAVGSAVNLVLSLGPQQQVLRIIVKPPSARLTVGQSVSFTAEVLFANTGWQVVPVTWIPGNPFTCVTPGQFIIRAVLQGVDGIANVTCDADWSVPPFEPPITGAGDRGRVPQAGPAEYKWYAYCEPRSSEVTYGEHLLTGRKIMAGPFPGPRTAYDWINSNCPRWRCDAGGACATAPRPGQGGEWKVFCGRNDLVVYLGKTYDPTRHILVQEGFLGEPDARAWVNQYYPGWLCTQTGAAASGPRMGGSWAVVCSKKHGGVSLTQHPSQIDFYVWGQGFLGEPDARAWTQRNCPSWRCDAQGRCLIGAVQRTPEERPLETPPEFDFADSWRRFSEGFSAGAREGAEHGRPGPSPVETRGGATGSAASSATSGKPAPDKPSAQGVDSKAQRDEYFKKCTAMREPYVKRNCTPAPGYSGCALDPQGCANYIIVNALPDGKSRGRVGCGRGVVDSYISCLRDCNERLVARKLNVFSIGPCGTACRDKADTATKACNAGER